MSLFMQGQRSMEPRQSWLKALRSREFKSRLMSVAGPSDRLFHQLSSKIIKMKLPEYLVEATENGQMVLHGSPE